MSAKQEQPGRNLIGVPRLKGLNERLKYVNPDPAEFDLLVGYIQQTVGVLERAPGIRFYQKVTGKVLNIHQTFDSRRNVLVQTDQGLLQYSEDQLFNRAPTTNLIPVAVNDEDNMSQALLAHTEGTGTNGGTYTPALTWVTAPLNQIIHQLNPDGTAAAFVTALAANVFTLASGIYRFRIKSIGCDNAGFPNMFKARLFNVTTGLPAWNGLQNQDSTSSSIGVIGQNIAAFIEGTLNLAVPTQFRIEHFMGAVTTTEGFGRPVSSGAAEVYRFVEIIKTA